MSRGIVRQQRLAAAGQLAQTKAISKYPTLPGAFYACVPLPIDGPAASMRATTSLEDPGGIAGSCPLVTEYAIAIDCFDTAAPSLIFCPSFTGFDPLTRLRYQSSLSCPRLDRMSVNFSGPMSR